METQFTAEVLRLTNEFRAKNGLNPLVANDELDATATAHSKDMADQDYFDHTGQDGSKPWDRAETFGYEARSMGENIAAGYRTPEQVVQGWIDSPGHRANLLNESFTELGVGYHLLENDTGSVNYQRYWTQVFGSGDLNPESNVAGSESKPEPKPEPKSEPAPAPTSEPMPEAGPESPLDQPSVAELTVIRGTDGQDRLRGTALNELIQGFEGSDALRGEAGDDILMGGRGSDVLKGNQGSDLLIGVDLETAGRGERDVMRGGDDADIFVLGDESGAYYNDGDAGSLGRRDRAVIRDFDAAAGDVIQLHGDAEDYRLGSMSRTETVGIFLSEGDSAELVAVVRDGGDLNLSSDAVSFVG